MNIGENIKIKEEQNRIHDNTLDLLGNGFNFNHEKGLSEWLKNAIDAYIRNNDSDRDQHIILRFQDSEGGNSASIECIDFVGMEHSDIEKAFKWWGDPNASTRGRNIITYGGHGNGGKFYMRQMFQKSYFITYKNGTINVFGFNESRKYGYVPEYENKKISLNEALELAGLEASIIPKPIYEKLENGETGFTVVKGYRPRNIIGGKINVYQLCERFKYHPQARRPLKFCQVSIIQNRKQIIEKLQPDEIEPMSGFESIYIFDIPQFLIIKTGSDSGTSVEMSNKKYPAGKLELKTSSIPFSRIGRRAELNCIDIVGEIGVLGSYRMDEIGFLQYYPQAQYLYGECKCPILEDPSEDCVQNDREKLVNNNKTRALLEWIAEKIDEVGEKIAEKEKIEKQKENIKITDDFNQLLNSWKDQFMNKIFAEILGGPGKGNSTGGYGDDGSGGGRNEQSKTKNGIGSGQGEGGGEGEEKKKGSSMPRVLLSGQEDPDMPGSPVYFTERHALVEQRHQDLVRGIYWINLEKPMAKKIIETYGPNSPRWRTYLFQRYVDIFINQMIHRLAKKEGGLLSADIVDANIMRLVSDVYDKATVDLESFLLQEKYETGNRDLNQPQ